MTETKSRANEADLLQAVRDNSAEEIKHLLGDNPGLWEKYHASVLFSSFPLVKAACRRKDSPMRKSVIELLLQFGADVNAMGDGVNGLLLAVWDDDLELVRFLLERGANQTTRPVLRSIKPYKVNAIPIAELLIDYGADINQLEEIVNGQKVTPLDWALSGEKKFAEFLISRGAKTAEQLLGPQINLANRKIVAGDVLRKHVDRYFARVFGRPSAFSIQAKDAGKVSIKVGCVPHGSKRGIFKKPHPNSVYFTNGLSQQPLAVPFDKDEYRYAELVVQLPETWPPYERAIQEESTAWPIQWLGRIASRTINSGDWLGDNLTLIANEDLKPLGPECNFVAWLLLMRHTIPIRRDQQVAVYSCFPIYREEYELGKNHGVALLAEKLGSHGIEDAIDLNRQNVGNEI